MFAFTRKTDYALLSLAALAEAAETAEHRLMSARQIADGYQLSHPLVMNVLKDLLRAGIVRSTRGAKGGYSLDRAPSAVTVQEVLVAIEGQPALASCCSETTSTDSSNAVESADCQVGSHCPITHAVQRLNERIQDFLGDITLADLMNDPIAAGSQAPQVVPLSTLRSSAKGVT